MCQRIRLKCFIWWCRNDLHRARLLCFQKRNEVLSRWTYNEHPACLAKLKNRHPAQCPNMRVVKCQVQIFKTQKQHWQQLWLWSSLWLIPYDWASNMGSKQQEAKQREMNVCLCLCELFFPSLLFVLTEHYMCGRGRTEGTEKRANENNMGGR